MRAPIVTLLTDFGTADGYAAEMTGVIASAAPDARIMSVSHDIPPQDVARARLAVSRYWRAFPRGTVHLVVVDPGVGTSRAALAVESDGRFLVGPDNGVLSPALVLAGTAVVMLTVPDGAAPTFHGRDVFAPAAARLARGDPLAALGKATDAAAVTHAPPPPRRDADGTCAGEVIAIDRFGNAITNLAGPAGTSVFTAGREIPVVRTYGDVAAGCPCALLGSAGLLEVAVRDGNAAAALGLVVGTPVRAAGMPEPGAP